MFCIAFRIFVVGGVKDFTFRRQDLGDLITKWGAVLKRPQKTSPCDALQACDMRVTMHSRAPPYAFLFFYHSLYCIPRVCLFYSVFYLYGAAACQLFIKQICYVNML